MARALLLFFLALTSFAMHEANAQDPVSGSISASGYMLGPEDVLEISVWKEENLQREVLVRPDGKISFPLVGDIQAEGKTPEQLRHEIAGWLRKYIPDPVVTVLVKKVAANKIYVLGQINKPGQYMVGSYLDVMQVLALAGGLNAFAAENDIRILRRQGDKEVVIPFEYSEVKKGRKLAQNIILQNGDVVVVP
jgi:polysaccharide export outer membrane protein